MFECLKRKDQTETHSKIALSKGGSFYMQFFTQQIGRCSKVRGFLESGLR